MPCLAGYGADLAPIPVRTDAVERVSGLNSCRSLPDHLLLGKRSGECNLLLPGTLEAKRAPAAAVLLPILGQL